MSVTPIKILLVEDNPGDIELTRVGFEEARISNSLTVISDGAEAMAFFQQGENLPDIVLLDINLPKVDGVEILKQIRSNSSSKDISVIMMTSSGAEDDIKNSLDGKANSYITKPVNFNKFYKVLITLEKFWLTVVKSPDNQ